ncbi:MAG: hypothetical protein EA397_07650 [Deltaproteobacteria bacterium]|nr:MAG: hypothetical protein EA397_07650 [Deltaproteobacteria bacterium]
MRPIKDIADLREGNVLYHSAFGFAQVREIRQADVCVRWAQADRNLPEVISRDTLRRVYTVCRPEGFFERALLHPSSLQEFLQVEPLEALSLLLGDLAGPQSPDDLREWLVTLGLVTREGYDRWWSATEARARRDARFRENKGMISLKADKKAGSADQQLEDPLLSAAQRLDLALELRERIGEDAFRQHACTAWRSGGSQVRELAFQALSSHPPSQVLSALLGPGPDNVEALIHLMRRSGWTPDQFDEPVLEQLLDRIREGAEQPGLLDDEGRLAAATARWWPEGGLPLMVELSAEPRTQRLVDAALNALPPNRAEALHLAILSKAIDDCLRPASLWLGWRLVDSSPERPSQIADRVEGNYALIARWLRENMLDDDFDDLEDDLEDGPLVTMEVEMVPVGDQEPMSLADLPTRSGRTILTLAWSMVQALAEAHEQGRTVNPTKQSFVLQTDGTVLLRDGDPDASHRLRGESPSPRSDVYATAILLIESMIGRNWPGNMPGDRVVPYLRYIIADLPPSVLGPLDAAVHPDPDRRPADALEWRALWKASATAETARRASDSSAVRQIVVGYDTHIGVMKMLNTQTNQDALAVSSRGGMHLLCVCDGISTANAGSGDVASGLTTNVISGLWEQSLPQLRDADDFTAEAFIERALALANRSVCQQALRYADGDLSGRVPMGTTVVVALVRGSRVQLGWLGDSRAYVVGKYGASLLTADMNQAAERLRLWQGGHELRWDPAGYALIGYIGHFNEDYRDEPLQPHQLSFTLLPGERLVLCSDGITDYIAQHHPAAASIVYRASAESHPADAAVALTAAANRGGGGDNCSVIVATLIPNQDDVTGDVPEDD